MKKLVCLDKHAVKELQRFPKQVILKFQALFEFLEIEGKIEEPFGKKLSGKDGLFELRVKYQGQWRAIYAYVQNRSIIILSAFRKKTQKTPKEELEKAKKRLNTYGEEL